MDLTQQIRAAKSAEVLLLRYDLTEEAATLRGLIERAVEGLPLPGRTAASSGVIAFLLARLMMRLAI